MVCKSCKNEIDNTSSFCIYCGAKTNIRKISLSAKIFISICLILILLSFIIPIIRTIKLSFTEYISPEEFIEYIKNKNCTLINDINNKDNKDNITIHYKTDKNTCPYEIDYYIIDDKNTKYNVYENITKEIYNYNNITKTERISSINYYLDSSESASYLISILANNSIIYIKTNIENKTEVLNMLNDLGYNTNLSNNIFITNNYIHIIIAILVLTSWWKLNMKIGRKGYICLIPIYNIICLTKDVFGTAKYCLFLLLPIINVIFIAFLLYNLGKTFNQNTSYCTLMWLFPLIFIPIIAFDNSQYIGPIKKM